MTRRTKVRQMMITVLVLENQFAGALAYALQRALHEPARVRVVRAGGPPGRDPDLGLPLPIHSMTAEAAEAMVQEAASSDVLVVESHPHLDEVNESLLQDLRRHASCLVVEVDQDGQVVGASGPEGWTYSAFGEERDRESRRKVAVDAPTARA